MAEDKPEIFIDEGWKAQVQREKEEAARRRAAEAAAQVQASPVAPEPDAASVGMAADAPGQMPEPGEADEEPLEANFTTLVASLATQAMMALGVMAPPGARQVMVNLDQAKFSIDTLEVLEEKTRGNLSAEEAGNLREALAELQRLYATRLQQFQEQAMREGGFEPTGQQPR